MALMIFCLVPSELCPPLGTLEPFWLPQLSNSGISVFNFLKLVTLQCSTLAQVWGRRQGEHASERILEHGGHSDLLYLIEKALTKSSYHSFLGHLFVFK